MSLSMLHCEGEKIINSEGKQVFLRGTNLGGWLLDELWQGFFKGGEAQWDIVTTLEIRFGKEEADRLIKIREDNYITEYDHLKECDVFVIKNRAQNTFQTGV